MENQKYEGEKGWIEDSLESVMARYFVVKYVLHRASLVAQLVKKLPAMQETPIQFLGWEDPLEKG